jgi:hypothetical protein
LAINPEMFFEISRDAFRYGDDGIGSRIGAPNGCVNERGRPTPHGYALDRMHCDH